MWTDKHDPDTIFIDIRREVGPDVICSWQYLPFKNRTFRLINFDPPQMVYRVEGKPSFLTEKYGLLERETWPRDLTLAFNELWRVLKRNSTLLLKWNDNHIPAKKLLALFKIKPKFGTPVGGSRGFRNKHSKEPRSTTSWFCFVKK